MKIEPGLVTEGGKQIFQKVESYIKERLSLYEERSLTRIATFLDSRFRRLGFQNKANFNVAREDVENLVNERLRKTRADFSANDQLVHQEFSINNSIFDFLGELDTPDVETSASGIIITGDYLKSPKLSTKASDVEVMNNLKNRQHPAILYIALKYLSTPGSSVPVERLVSAAGQIVSKRRNRLGSKNIHMLVFLNKNYDLVNEFDDEDEEFVLSDEDDDNVDEYEL